MAAAPFSYATEPFVEKNQFRQQAVEASPIPPLAEVRSKLPVPLLPQHPDWVELYWQTWEMAWDHLRQPAPNSGFVANYIEAAYDRHTFMADSAYMVLFGLYGRRAFNFMGTLDNFYARQHDDGFIGGAVNVENGRDVFYPFDPNSTGPNILAWAEWHVFRQSGNDGRLEAVFWPLLALHRWYRANRTWPNGLYWATGLSSGMDNQPRVPDSRTHHQHWTWVDASMQAALSCQVLAQMAMQLGEDSLSVALQNEHTQLIELANKHLWNESAQFYQDVDPHGRFSRVKSAAAYWALLDKEMVPEKRLASFIQPLRENWAFKLPHRVPSQSADSEAYNAETGNYWRGAVWPTLNFVVLRGLRQIGQHGLAHEIAVNHLQHVSDVYQQTQTLWENYAPESTAPGDPAKKDFVGTTGLTPIAILLEDVIGLSVDWPQRRVFWDRRLPAARPYGVRNYPLGPEGALHIEGDTQKVRVITDAPFTLTIRDAAQSLQTAVAGGTTEIELE